MADDREHPGYGRMRVEQKGRWLDGGGAPVGGGGANKEDQQDPPPLDSYFQGGRAMQGKSAQVGDGTNFGPVAELVRIESDSRDAQILSVLVAPEFGIADQPPSVKAVPGVYLWLPGIFSAGGGDPTVAIIEWGIAGYQSQAEVDIGSGVCFSVPASFLIVKARIDLGIIAHPPGFHPFAKLGAFVSRDSLGGSNKPQRSRFPVASSLPIAPAGITTVNVPPFSRAMFFERRPQLATLLSFIANGTVRYEVLVPGGVSLPAISLSSDIDQVRATNEDGAVSIIAARFIFELAL